jgi:hypothetical protein
MGLSGSAGVGVSIPANPFSHGIQVYGSASGTFLAGLGFFAGAGPTGTVGYSNGPLKSGLSSSTTGVLQGGVAVGAGGEASVTVAGGNGGSISGGERAGMGAYAAYGGQWTGTAATPLIGC